MLRVWNSGFREFEGLGFRVQGLGMLRVWDSRFRDYGV